MSVHSAALNPSVQSSTKTHFLQNDATWVPCSHFSTSLDVIKVDTGCVIVPEQRKDEKD